MIIILTYHIFSFGLATETKSERVIKTPSKFSTCVSGKRKAHKSCKAVSEVSSIPVPQLPLCSEDVTSASLLVNTSTMNDDDDSTDGQTECETTLTCDPSPESVVTDQQTEVKDQTAGQVHTYFN